MKKLFFASLFLACSLFGGELNIAASMNNKMCFDEIKSEFNKAHPDIILKPSFAASGILNSQIKNGAPFDVFMSANVDYAKDLFEKNLAVTKPEIYAKGKIVLICTKGCDLSKGLQSLKDEKIKTIAIANPKIAPYGIASIQALKNAGIYESIKDKIVYAKSISEALSKALSAADAGFASGNFVNSKMMKNLKENKDYIWVDEKLYDRVNQALTILKKAQNNPDAKAFVDFIMGKKGREIYKKYGYGI